MNTKNSDKVAQKLLFAFEKRILCFKLRYGQQDLNPKMVPLMNQSDIARILNMSIPSVIMALNNPASPKDKLITKKLDRRSKVRDHHVEFLISQETLNDQAEKTLAERCVLLHRKFPELKISPSYLSLIYKKNSIRRKVIILGKELRPWQRDKFSAMFQQMKSEIRDALSMKKKILFVDESMFTTAQRLTHAFSNKKSNIRVD